MSLVSVPMSDTMSHSTSRLMSGPFWSATLELVREARWWWWAPSSSSGCPWATLILGAIALACCCFCSGFLFAVVVLSGRCRQWLWQCILSAFHHWADLGAGEQTTALRRRFREYRA